MRRPVLVSAFLAALLVPALGEPRTVEAQQPEAWLTPASGTCAEPLTLHGEGFPANTTVEVTRPEWIDSVDLGEVVTDEAGRFETVLGPEARPETCNPGQRFAIFARVPGPSDPSHVGVAVYAVETPWRLEIVSEGTCDTVPSYLGTGFPPGERVSIWFSNDTSWAAHDFAELAQATADAEGTFVVEALRELPCSMVGDGMLIVARLEDRAGAYAGWSTWFILSDHGPPLEIAPAGTGHGPLPGTEGAPRLLLVALLALTVAFLATARGSTRFR